MAAPTPTTRTHWNGKSGYTTWHAVWTDGTQLTDSVLVDISSVQKTRPLADGQTRTYPVRLRVKRIQASISGDTQVILEWDADTDQHLWRFDNNADSTEVYDLDFDPPVYDPQATGYTGDILLTTVGAAAGDEIQIRIDYDTKS